MIAATFLVVVVTNRTRDQPRKTNNGSLIETAVFDPLAKLIIQKNKKLNISSMNAVYLLL